MGKVLGIAVIVVIGVVAFGYVGSGFPDTNPLHAVATGVRTMIDGILTSIAGVGRGVAGVFGG